MSAAENKAVFLSYASQDAEAARGICNALRAAGVEVWFDQSELRGGDAWDAKIRKQIKECALFVPIISANTQARHEGYFRLEWRLADQRTHLMGKSRAFLLPVCIDDTGDAHADVPDSFVAVQWTRLPNGEAPPAFGDRVKVLLDRPDEVVSRDRSPDSPPTPSATSPRSPRSRRQQPVWIVIGLGLAFVTAAGLAIKHFKSATGTVALPKAMEFSEARKLVEKARAVFEAGDLVNRETYALTEALLKKAEDLDVTEAEAWALHAAVSWWMDTFGLDTSAERKEAMRLQAERAIKLAPTSVSARLAYATMLLNAAGNTDEAEQIFKTLVAERPDDWRVLNGLALLHRRNGRTDEAIQVLQRARRLSEDHQTVTGDLLWMLVTAGRYTAAESVVAELLPRKSSGRVLEFDVRLKLNWRGDAAAAAAALGRWPAWMFNEDRGVQCAAQVWMWNREPANASAALARFPRDYIRHARFTGPRAALTAWLHEQAGNPQAALADWKLTIQAADRELSVAPTSSEALHWKAWALARLGDRAAAEPIVRELIERNVRTFRWNESTVGLVALGLVVDKRDWAFEELKSIFSEQGERESVGFVATRAVLDLNPIFDPVRNDPRFLAIRASAPAPETNQVSGSPVASPNAKTIAVLPFANLSTEKENEFFADGVQDDVITNLAKIRDLTVISRTSTLAYRDNATRNLKKIAADLGVATILEGSVRRVGSKVHLNAQLIDARTDAHLWAESFDGDASDPFALQASLAQKIAAALKATLTPGERTSLNRRPTENAAAYEYFLQAKLLSAALYSPSPDADWDRVFGLLEKSTVADPKFSQAHALLARTHSALYFYRRQTKPEERERARERLEVARQLAPDAPETRTAEGFFAYACLQDYPTASRHLERAVAEIPNDARTWYYLGLTKRRLGHPVDGVAAMERALQLDPHDSAIISNLMLSLLQLRRFSRVVAIDRQAVDATGDNHQGNYALTLARYEIDGNKDALLAGCCAWVPTTTNPREERPDLIAALLSGGLEAAARAAEKMEGRGRAHHQALFAHLLGRAEEARRYARLAEDESDAGPALDWPHGNEVKRIELLMYSGRTAEALTRARALQPKLHGFDDLLEIGARNKLGRVYALAGARDDALAILRELITGVGMLDTTPRMVRLDPCWSKLADDPRFEEILRAAKPL